MFKVDYSKVEESSYGALPEGNYECVIESTQEKVTKNNKEALNIRLIVRNDLTKVPALANTNGKYANRYLFDDHWKRDINGQYTYHMGNLMYVLKAAGIPEGTEINSMDGLHEILKGKPVKIYTKVEKSDYSGEDENTIAPWGYSQSDYPNVQHQFKGKDDTKATDSNPFEGVNTGADITDEDLPF